MPQCCTVLFNTAQYRFSHIQMLRTNRQNKQSMTYRHNCRNYRRSTVTMSMIPRRRLHGLCVEFVVLVRTSASYADAGACLSWEHRLQSRTVGIPTLLVNKMCTMYAHHVGTNLKLVCFTRYCACKFQEIYEKTRGLILPLRLCDYCEFTIL